MTRLGRPPGPDVVVDSKGYRSVLIPGRARVREHHYLAERALGKMLPKGVQVHHVNEIKSDNGRGNLVLCQDAAYHKLLHYRTKARAACGNADWLRCYLCDQWDEPSKVWKHPRRAMAAHPACARESLRAWKAGKEAA